MRTKITRVPCRRRNEGSIPRAEKFGDLITADHKVFNEEVNLDAVAVQDPTTQWIQSYPRKNKDDTGDGSVSESFSSRRNSRKSFTPTIIGIWQILWRSIIESLNFYTFSIRDEWYCSKSSAQNQRRNFCCIVASRLGWKMVGGFHGMVLQSATCPRPPGRRANSVKKTIASMQKKYWLQKGAIFFKISNGRWYSKIVRKRPRILRTHSKAGPTCREWRSQRRNSRRIGGVSTGRTNRWRWNPCRLLVDPWWLLLSSSQWTSGLTLGAEGGDIHYSTEIHGCYKVYSHWSGSVTRKEDWRLLETFVRFLEKDSQNSIYWEKNVQMGKMWSGGRLTKIQTTTRPDYVWRSLDKIVQAAQNREQTRVSKRKAEAR